MDPGFFFIAGFFKVLGWLLFLALIFGAIRFFKRARYAGTNGWGGRGWGGGWNPGRMMGGFGRDEAMETARERLARSELTPEQFEDIKRGLQSNTNAQHDSGHHNAPRGGDWHDWKREWKDARRGWGRDNALETARMRLAKGEISSEEFEMIRRTLES
ncbi:MAG: hypothetical protein HC933_04830 [Pleurocapsa sp. SU_196_0]|nr:hypothetical protein [Pleurocapsa sp. SU_196_0]